MVEFQILASVLLLLSFWLLVLWPLFFLAAALEGEFCDAGLVEFAFAHVSELGVLIESRLGEWRVDALRCR